MHIMLNEVEFGVFTLAVILSVVEESLYLNMMRFLHFGRNDMKTVLVIGRHKVIHIKFFNLKNPKTFNS